MEQLLNEKIREFKQKENDEMNRIKSEHDIKVKAYRDKYKQLEENEFAYYENEYNKNREKMENDFKTKITNLERQLKLNQERLEKQEFDYKKRVELLDEKRQAFNQEWKKMSEDELKLNEKRAEILENQAILNSSVANNNNNDVNNINFGENLQMRYEIEKLKLEKADLEVKLQNMQLMLDKFSIQKTKKSLAFLSSDHQENSDLLNESLTSNKRTTDEEEEDDFKDLMNQAKLRLKLKYTSSKISNNNNETSLLNISSSSNEESTSYDARSSKAHSANTDLKFSGLILSDENRKSIIENLTREKDSLQIAFELLDRYRQSIKQRKTALDSIQTDLNYDEKALNKSKPNSNKNTDLAQLRDKKLNLERELIDIEQLNLNLNKAKRLIKQKSSHLNLIEEKVEQKINKRSNFAFLNSSIESEADDDVKSSIYQKSASFLVKQNEIDLLLNKLPQINLNLEKVLETLAKNLDSSKSSNLNRRHSLVNYDPNFINEKWNKYLGESNKFNQHSMIASQVAYKNTSSFTIRTGANKDPVTVNKSWENSPAYQKLTLDSGTRVLEEKYNQYLSGTSNPNFLTPITNKFQFSKTLNNLTKLHGRINNTFKPPFSNPNLVTASNSSSLNHNIHGSNVVPGAVVTLPESTKNRLNMHRDWLRKFKADLEMQKTKANF
jgi:hypothetical protein